MCSFNVCLEQHICALHRLATIQLVKIVPLFCSNNNSAQTAYRYLRGDYGQFNRPVETAIRYVVKRNSKSIGDRLSHALHRIGWLKIQNCRYLHLPGYKIQLIHELDPETMNSEEFCVDCF